LYYFLLKYPGRTLVFVNSISCVRRLVPILALLKVPVWGMHAQMQQRQRLKNLDRFKSLKNSVLVATDVLARGVDITKVEHVVHYQIPRTAEIYIHRSGRTARAFNSGLSLMLVSPPEVNSYKSICQVLNKEAGITNSTQGITDFPVDQSVISAIKARLTAAQTLNTEIHAQQKDTSNKSWYTKQAELLDIELDDTTKRELGSSDQFQKKRESIKVKNLKDKLNSLLSKPLVPQGKSTRYYARDIFVPLGSGEVKYDALIDLEKKKGGTAQVKKSKVEKSDDMDTSELDQQESKGVDVQDEDDNEKSEGEVNGESYEEENEGADVEEDE